MRTLLSDIWDKMGDIKLVDNDLMIMFLFNYKKGAEGFEMPENYTIHELSLRFFYSD